MNAFGKLLVVGVMIFFAACATTIKIPGDVHHDYNVNVDITKLRTYDLSPASTTVGIEYLMMERIKTAVHTVLQAKNMQRTSQDPDFLVTVYGVRSKVFTTAWRGFDSDLIVEKSKLVLRFVDPETKQLIWWGASRAILEPQLEPDLETQLVNDVVHRILQKFPPLSL